MDLTDTLNNIDYSWVDTYKPTPFAIKFINFIKLVNGGKGEENLSPVIHYHMLDQLTKYRNNLFVAFRGSGKSSLFGEYLFLYLAVFNKLPMLNDVSLAIYVSDTIENGVKSLRNNIESRYAKSEFLQKYVPSVKFTDNRVEFENVSGKKFIYRAFGASTGIRGVKEQGIRPSLCHKKGTVVMTDMGQHKVEDYYKKGDERQEKGYIVSLHGFDEKEVVTEEHRYKTLNGKWIEAKDLKKGTILVKPIDMIENDIPDVVDKTGKVINSVMQNKLFWRFYGYYLACGNFHSYRTVTFNSQYVTPNFISLVRKLKFKLKIVNEYWHIQVNFDMYNNIIKELFRCTTVDGWVKQIGLGKQKEIINGFMEGQKLSSKKYIPLLSHNLGCIAERLGYLYETLGGKLSLITDNSEALYRDKSNVYRVVAKTKMSGVEIFIPIQTPTHEYETFFGISHNCVIDDIMSDKNADSPTITEDIRKTIYAASNFALHPTNQIVWVGTPFNKKDPLYSSFGTEMWNSNAYPIAEEFPIKEDKFIGAWEDRFSYEFINRKFRELQSVGEIDAFNKEFMLKIMSNEDRLVLDDEIVYTNETDYFLNKEHYNFYITTDIAVSEKQKADFSVIAVWCYDKDQNWILVDGLIDRININTFIDELFRLVGEYGVSSVVMEKSATQKGFIDIIEKEMINRQQYFYLARDRGSSEAGFQMSTSKLARFNKVLPLFKLKKIMFHKFIETRLMDKEGLDELKSVTYSGIKSKHDDFVDAVSQLSYILPFVKELDEIADKEIKKVVDRSVFNVYNFDDDDLEDQQGSIKDYL